MPQWFPTEEWARTNKERMAPILSKAAETWRYIDENFLTPLDYVPQLGWATKARHAPELLEHGDEVIDTLQAIGPWTMLAYRKLQQEFGPIIESAPYLKNKTATLRKLGNNNITKWPEYLFFRGQRHSETGIGEVQGLVENAIRDTNVGLGIHVASDPHIARDFATGGGDLFSLKVRARNPIYYPSETSMQRELILNSIAEDPKALEKIVKSTPNIYKDKYGIEQLIKNKEFDKLLGLAETAKPGSLEYKAGINRIGALYTGLTRNAELGDKASTRMLETWLRKGHDAFAYRNEYEGLAGSPSLIVPFRKQIEVLDKFPIGSPATKTMMGNNRASRTAIKDNPWLDWEATDDPDEVIANMAFQRVYGVEMREAAPKLKEEAKRLLEEFATKVASGAK